MRPLALLLVLLLTGGHLACLQVAAWGGMFAERVQSGAGICRSLVATVDGSRPCRLCCAVRDLADDHGKQAPADQLAKKADKAQAPGWSLPCAALLPAVRYEGSRVALPAEPQGVELPPPRG